ncbi:MAG: tRNA pseudouridine(55) synthase TruB [Dehalococcoidia bacterium]|nr:tRNA pseudouridine(55) synthase TruB [Dehalococcoidia bacterium]MDD5493504.1 tRNA pseudouridine(55) synthase TruB [Dehalococcoidia bacterium]
MCANGILNVNKPAGRTSFSIVSRLRKLSGEKRVGHAGTLDPLATGVLPVCFGQATRIVEYLMNHSKTYVATIELGVSTDTYDREGRITGQMDTGSLSLSAIEDALQGFLGAIKQVPPVYSALKFHGEKYYNLARAGKEVNPPPREVTIEKIDILKYANPLLQIEVYCSRGTYIRSLANDLGKQLACGACLRDLARSGYGPFKLENSVTCEEAEAAAASGKLAALLYPADLPIADWPLVVLDSRQIDEIIKGQNIALLLENDQNNTLCRAYNSEHQFVAVLKYVQGTGTWHPEKVFLK